SYCASSVMGILRRRSIDNVIQELVETKNKYPFIELINFFDDTFFGGKDEFFEEFSKKYKKRIGLPFHAQCSPTTITEKKLESLIEAGLVFTEMGIQTGSSRIKRMYRRPTPNKKILGVARLIDKYRHKLLAPDYHIILDNPWERQEDVRATLDVILKLPRPYRLQISSLVLFPGTELHKKAKAEGLIKDEIREIYRKPFLHPQGTFLNYLIYLAGFCYFPRGLLKLLSRKSISRVFNLGNSIKLYHILYWLTERIVLFKKGVISLTHGDLARIRQYFLRQKTI
ncbi:MAG: radical SAM protein, partial [Candidatus Omnitrophica bacterium]|nr:radical SAM protein [Candidatus Omnitrophota bacterium]